MKPPTSHPTPVTRLTPLKSFIPEPSHCPICSMQEQRGMSHHMTNVDEWWGDPIRIYIDACHDEYEHSNSNIWTETLGTLSSPPHPPPPSRATLGPYQDHDVTCVAMTSSYPGLLHLTLLGFLLVVIPSSPRPPRRGTCQACHEGTAFLGKPTKENLRA